MNKTLKLSNQILVTLGASLGLSTNTQVAKDGKGFISLFLSRSGIAFMKAKLYELFSSNKGGSNPAFPEKALNLILYIIRTYPDFEVPRLRSLSKILGYS